MNRPFNHREPLSPVGSQTAGVVNDAPANLAAPATSQDSPECGGCGWTGRSVPRCCGGSDWECGASGCTGPIEEYEQEQCEYCRGSGTIEAATLNDGYGTKPRCLTCGRGQAGCICNMPDPEPEYFKPGLNRDPDAGWALAERSALR